MDMTVDKQELKGLLKEVIIEIMEERRDLVHDAVMEALEDVALVRAMEEGMNTPRVDCAEIFQILGDAS